MGKNMFCINQRVYAVYTVKKSRKTVKNHKYSVYVLYNAGKC